MNQLVRKPLRDLCTLVTDGTHDSPKSQSTGFPLIKGKDINTGQISFAACDLISPEDHQKVISRSKPEYGDTLFANIGASIGDTAYVNTYQPFSIKNVALFKPDKKVTSPRYLYYCIKNPSFKTSVVNKKSGSAQPFVGLADLRAHELVVHADLDVQRRVAEILSAYDDLIENNTRRIAILEDMAHRLFDEWFGRDADAGEPEPVRMDALIDLDPKTKVAKEGSKPFLPMPCVPTNSMVVSEWEEREGNAGSKFLNGDTLLARITPCLENGKTAFVDFLPDGTAGFGSTEFIVMRGREVPPEFVYCLARSEAFREHAIKSMSGATGRQRVSSAAVAQFEIASPHPERLEKFGEAARPMFSMVRSLADANNNLRAARDLLLPKLLSGEIEVRTAEEELEAVAA